MWYNKNKELERSFCGLSDDNHKMLMNRYNRRELEEADETDFMTYQKDYTEYLTDTKPEQPIFLWF